MGQPVKLSDDLVAEARAVVPWSERSIAGQIEYWAALGRAVDSLLYADQVISLRKAGATRRLSDCIADVVSATPQQRLDTVLEQCPFPRFRSVPGQPELLRRIEADGTESIGRFVGGKFLTIPEPT